MAQKSSAQEPEQCVLAGIVFDSATNAGVPRALVSYGGLQSGYRFTDPGGNFRVERVPCGGYSLSVSKPGFVPAKEQSAGTAALFGLTRQDGVDNTSVDQASAAPRPSNQNVDLSQNSQPARIALYPVSSIAGVVLDENSEPLPGVSVQGIVVQASLSGADYVIAQTARTDDRGRYSLLHLSPGDYIVRLAGEVSSTRYFQGSSLNLNNDHRGMQPVYYPNVDSTSSAMVIHLAPGGQATADFRHPTGPAFDINGRLTGFAAQAWTQMQVYRDGDKLPVGGVYVNLSSGQFRAVDVPPGSYTLRVAQYQADPPQWLAAETPVIVQSEPIRDLMIPLSRGVDIPVSVSYEAGAEAEKPIQLLLQPQHSRGNARHLMINDFQKRRGNSSAEPSQATSQPDTPQPSVLVDVIPDKYRLLITPLGVTKSYVASARLGDVDVLRGEFPVVAGAELHVTIRGDTASVHGQVAFQGRPAAGVQIYIIPKDGAASGARFGVSDPEGRYEIAGAPPGDFRIQAWVGAPTAKDILSGSGDTLTLQPGENRTVNLDAAPSSDPEKNP